MIAIGLEEIMRKGRGMPECIRLIGNINARTALSRPYRIPPPPYHIAPPIPRAIRVGAATDAITRRQYAQAPHLMTPPFTVLWVCLPTILVIGNVPLGGVPATQHRCSGISSRSSLYFESIQGYPYH